MDLGETELLVAIVLLLLVIVYYHLTSNFDFWQKRGVLGPKPIPFYGNFKDVIQGKIHVTDFHANLITAYPDEPVIGLFSKRSPILMVKDPEVVKDVLIKSFSSFSDRGVHIYEDIDPLSAHLLYLEPERWKPVRTKLSPVFTAGKLKDMFYMVTECADQFNAYLQKLVSKSEVQECCELMAKFTTDVIGVCVFGLRLNAMEDENCDFRRYGKATFEKSLLNSVRRALRQLPHWLAKSLRPIARNEPMVSFFVGTIKETMRYRQEHGVRRNDFIDHLMDIKDETMILYGEEMSDTLLTAQAYVFFIAGYETSSTTLSTGLYELAMNPDIQQKLREEVEMSFKDNDGKLTYDSIKNMKYLDKVVKETLRKCPAVYVLTRKAINDHTFSSTNISIPKETRLFVPVYAIHHDPKVYPEPKKFDPERFDEEIEKTRNSMSYLPFGEGPRNCIGLRFGKMQVKIGLANLIKNFAFEICDKTDIPYEKNTHSVILSPKSIFLRIKKL